MAYSRACSEHFEKSMATIICFMAVTVYILYKNTKNFIATFAGNSIIIHFFMNENLDATGKGLTKTELEIEKVLRPTHFEDFAGQKKMVENLKVLVEAAKQRNESLDHVLLHGPPGLGKTTLSYIIANEMEVSIKVSSGPVRCEYE